MALINYNTSNYIRYIYLFIDNGKHFCCSRVTMYNLKDHTACNSLVTVAGGASSVLDIVYVQVCGKAQLSELVIASSKLRLYIIVVLVSILQVK